MMLRLFQTRVKARVASMRRKTPQQIQESARLKRESRAQTVTDLQIRVRHLQQQITDLTAEGDEGGERDIASTDRTALADLEKELATAQDELARYQGRI